ncbi:MAG TPA: hypothetical protein VNR87_14660 [Flavisolibacter sp.]|nr:hypothetical protein [Flavisolibacter sp.]
MKRLLFCTIIVMSSVFCFATPNEKVLNSFASSFPKADSVNWYENENDYEVHFNINEIRCRLWYDKEGTVIKSVRYYLQNMLPPIILSKVQHKYADKSVFGVTEVTTPEDGVQYFIVLQDDKKWYNITSDSAGNLVMTKKFNKA